MQGLAISEDGRRLTLKDGTPFFWLGDTAWELIHRMNADEAEYYFKRRAEQGFNVIQTVALAEFDGLRTPNAYGEVPFHALDSDRPNEAYFRYADEIVDLAARYGHYVALLPSWGDKVLEPGEGPRIFHPDYERQGAAAAIARARRFGRWIGERYRDKPNLVWVLGGDRDYDDKNDPDGTLKKLWQQMAEGIREGDGGTHLITFHVCRGSSLFYPDADWLDFHMTGSYLFAQDLDTSYLYIERDYALVPPKPTLDAEPRYEGHTINWDAGNGYFDDYDARQAAYWSVFAGACGHTYGCAEVWQFFGTGHPPISDPRYEWQEAMELPGASQMGLLRQLVESRPAKGRKPCQARIVDARTGGEHVLALEGERHVWAYSPRGCPFELKLQGLDYRVATARWFDPRNGEWTDVGTVPTGGIVRFAPPSAGRGNDWVLALDAV